MIRVLGSSDHDVPKASWGEYISDFMGYAMKNSYTGCRR